MHAALSHRPLLVLILLISLSNLGIYFAASSFHSSVPFNYHNYTIESHHFIPDLRTTVHRFNLPNALSQFDSQWYLKIAVTGYPLHPTALDQQSRLVMSSLTYAYFPLYPLLLRFLNFFFSNIELTAFTLSNFLILINSISLFYVIKKIYSVPLAFKTVLITFLFPFSIFFRSYYPEGIQLFLLIWFSYFILRKNFVISSVFLSLLSVTKGNLLLLNFVYLFQTFRQFRLGRLSLSRMVFALFLLSLPFSLWLLFNYRQTSTPFFFAQVQHYWTTGNLPPLLANFLTILNFTTLKFHLFHSSQVDCLSVIIIFCLLIKSRRYLKSELWLISLILWLTPLITKSLISFSRLQIISFPLSVFIASIFPHKYFVFLISLSYLLLLVSSVFFVNWYWLG